MDPARSRLADAIEALRTEERRFTSLSDAQNRAMQERHALMDALVIAERELAEATVNTPLQRVYAFANRRDFPVEPLAEHEAAVNTATAALERAKELGRQIDEELQRSEGRLKQCENAVTQAMAPVVVQSPQFLALFDKRTTAWTRLRSLYILFSEIFSALSANIPEPLCVRFQSHEPLQAGRSRNDESGKQVPFGCDERLLASWREALGALRSDHLAELPDERD